MSLGVRFISIPLFYDKQISLVSNVPYVLIGSNFWLLIVRRLDSNDCYAVLKVETYDEI